MTPLDFLFKLDANFGGNTGHISQDSELNRADIVGNQAVFVAPVASGICKITFSLNNQTLSIRTTPECQFFAGAEVSFGGDYSKTAKIPKLSLRDLKAVIGGGGPDEKDLHVFKDSKELEAFSRLVGSYQNVFLNDLMEIFREWDTEHLGARIYSGWVAGIAQGQAAMIIISPEGKKIWAAALDGYPVKIRYFTNVPGYEQRLPKTIQKWRGSFREIYPVIFMNRSHN